MLFQWFGKKQKQTQKTKNRTIVQAPSSESYAGLTQTVVFGMHLYRRPDEDSTVYFVDEKRNIKKKLVDKMGKILNFPGIEKEEFWTKEVTSPNAFQPQIRFRTSFEKRENSWIMLWQIQPDGRYWEDEDGYGMEKEEEVVLYTFVDQNGDFTGPFQIYSVGMKEYFQNEE